MFIKMHSNGKLGCSSIIDNGLFPRGWESEVFILVRLKNNSCALWSPIWKMFVKMNKNGTMACSPLAENGIVPQGWESEVFNLVQLENNGFAFWSPVWKMFIKMNGNGTMGCSPLVESGLFPKGWESEIFSLTILEETFSKNGFKALKEEEKKRKIEAKDKEKAFKLEEKAKAKQKKEEEKKKAKEQEMLKHKLKTSRGESYCVYCGEHDHSMYGNEICLGREKGHSFVFMKDKSDRWKLKCNKCGKSNAHSSEGCY